MKHHTKLTWGTPVNPARRKFLARAGSATMGSALMATGQLPLAARALAAGNYSNLSDYKTLVCVFLDGGNDNHNAFAPYQLADYNRYAAIRQGLAIPRNELLAGVGNEVGFHPGLSGLRTLFNEHKLALVRNVGNLFEAMVPGDLFNYYETGSATVAIPPDLFSHSHQTALIQLNFVPTPGSNPAGWGGLITDRLAAANVNPDLPSSFTISGTNLWQTGITTQPFSLQGGQAIPSFETFDGTQWPYWEPARSTAWANIIAQPHAHPLEAQAAHTLTGTKERSDLLRNALANAPSLNTPYDSDNWFAEELRSIAKLIAIRESVGMRRQIFYVQLGGFDTHANHLNWHAEQLARLNGGLYSFQRTLEEIGVTDTVTTFTFSEFGRTLTINGDGTDHAWAGDHIVMGGAVDGGKSHGTPITYSDVNTGEHWGETLFGDTDVGSGRFIPESSIDQYGATLARWMGITPADLSVIFPNLGNFSLQDLGFML